MKKLILLITFALMVSIAFGQTLKKGSLVSVHVYTINLDPDVTMNQFKAFYTNKLIPVIEKNFPGMKIFPVTGIRGEDENKLGWFYFFESEEVRDKYFKEDGGRTELGAAAFKKLKPTLTELQKLGTSTSKYTDWLLE